MSDIWGIRDVDEQARRRAMVAAKGRGQKVGEWLTALITSYWDGHMGAPRGGGEASGPSSEDRLEQMQQQLASLTAKVDQMQYALTAGMLKQAPGEGPRDAASGSAIDPGFLQVLDPILAAQSRRDWKDTARRLNEAGASPDGRARVWTAESIRAWCARWYRAP